MSWKESSVMSLRREFVALASQPGSNMRQLCRRFGISPTTGYKWLHRFRQHGVGGLEDRSRRPTHWPSRSPEQVETAVLEIRDAEPDWGGRKIARRLKDLHMVGVPAPSTITSILRRHGRLSTPSMGSVAYQRFEKNSPNELWQMDFKGDFALREGRCYPLTVLDDHSRFSLAIRSCSNQRRDTVRDHLVSLFRRYGMPERILADNGPPWGAMGSVGLTRLGAWLVRLGIRLSHSRPLHPQTLGKVERFHRSFKTEVLRRYELHDHPQCQRRFDQWREVYNFQRPHEALELEVPSSRYRASSRSYPERLPEMEFGPDDVVRKVAQGGRLSYRGRLYRISRALAGQQVALRPSEPEGIFEVFYFHHRVRTLDTRKS